MVFREVNKALQSRVKLSVEETDRGLRIGVVFWERGLYSFEQTFSRIRDLLL